MVGLMTLLATEGLPILAQASMSTNLPFDAFFE
jgi:hypothetical protein